MPGIEYTVTGHQKQMIKKPRNLTYHLYRLQQQLALTNREARALGALLFFLLVGLLTGAYQRSKPAVDPVLYATADSLFLAATGDMRAQALKESEADTANANTAPATTQLTTQLFAHTFPININTATATELEQLPRIGPQMAARIISFRQTHGGFRTKADLMRIKGIGAKTFAGLEDKITVE